MPTLTPEVIEAIARNADSLRAAITSGDEMTVLNGGSGCNNDECCCPKFIKFKFILCEKIEIENINAACAEEDD